MIPRLALFLTAAAAPLAAETAEQNFTIHCAACHAPDYGLVGPSVVEMAGIYKDDPAGFVKWTIAPGKKREQMIQMPSMAHLPEDTLREIHAYVLKTAEGKVERKPPTGADGDPYPYDGSRPKVQRMFMPDASPAAIAVALPGDISFCFDAAECRLRYVWKGGFIDGYPYWKGNGSSLAKIDGKVVYTEPEALFGATSSSGDTAFLGYELEDGIPTFRYRRDGVNFSERILPLPDGSGIVRKIGTDGSKPVRVAENDGAEMVVEPANPVPAAAREFTITLRWK